MNKRIQRAPRPPAVRGSPWLLLAGVTVAAIALLAVVIAANQPSPPTVNPAYALANGKTLGPAEAAVVVQVFSDFQCPFCRQFALGSEAQLIDRYIQAGKSVRLEYKHFIVIDGNVGGFESRHAAYASECAAEQGAFWPYHDVLFANVQGEGTGSLRDERLREFAKTVGLDTEQFQTCFDGRRYLQAVAQDEALAARLRVTSTPSLFVNGARVADFTDFASIAALIDAGLSR